jgi:hypothetical protein
MIFAVIAAFIGGVLRACLGIRKYNSRHGRFVVIISSGFVGILSGLAFLHVTPVAGNAALWAAGLAGYVGVDIIEALYKIRFKQRGVLI